ncbi:ceramidase [Yoonia maricola]|uniref:Ceramidase n=1 Tax=Yoonia maricola TaxID=420999 RepID=A0A2M8W266_9RHOB|nr:ceramidase domain-containing protein [Yoonia maricola]PJI85009.1 ceramidase [Yoonia maricola]
MDWFQQVDGYCERTDFSYWSEPLNAVTNIAFIIAALILWRRGAGVPLARFLTAVLFMIGVGSYLFHTHATIWALLLDVAPIGAFILIYLFGVNRDIVPMRGWIAFIATLGFFPYAIGVVWVTAQVPFFAISNFYWTVPLLLVIYAVRLRDRPQIVSGFLIGAAILTASITFRSVDEMLCDSISFGTHFVWHVLNGIMLGWMIHVYIRHMLATAPAER